MVSSFALHGRKYRSIEFLCQGCHAALAMLHRFVGEHRVWHCAECQSEWVYDAAGWTRLRR